MKKTIIMDHFLYGESVEKFSYNSWKNIKYVKIIGKRKKSSKNNEEFYIPFDNFCTIARMLAWKSISDLKKAQETYNKLKKITEVL